MCYTPPTTLTRADCRDLPFGYCTAILEEDVQSYAAE